ncbi:RepB plasmid partition [Mesorhizobium plurifarium]|uniref:RepB plasmid partition n=1 Tax=Mesorhizobium plurifarium TaxID=69974 RepID=A0A090D9S2_MESPL|nr:RepB plasmid partition [Mesorhizobium plurifarium]
MKPKRLKREAAYQLLLNSDRRHAEALASDQLRPKMRRSTPEFLRIYEAECRRKRVFVEEVEGLERRLNRIAAAVRLITDDGQFRALLASEGLATMPNTLALRFGDSPPAHTSSQPASAEGNPTSAGEICPGVLDLLRDCTGPAGLFTLLRLVLPIRQMEIVRLMIARGPISLNYVKMLVALTRPSLLVKDIHPVHELSSLSEDRRAEMECELAKLSGAFLDALDRRGPASLELVAARRYFDRLMDNSRVVRYLARNFPGHFEEFHNLSLPMFD